MGHLRFAIVGPAIVVAGNLVAQGQVYRDHVENAARVASVQQQIAELAPHQTVPVFLTRLQPRYGDGRYQNGVNRSYDSTLPEPRLPIPTYPSIFAGGAANR